MSCRDWLYHVAVRGCLIAAAILIWSNYGYAIGQPNNSTKHYQAEYQQLTSVRAPLVGIAKFGGPDDYNSPCQETQGGPYSDLCQQWRMAKAAEDQADWSFLQFILSIAGFGGLIGTLIFTAVSTRAASSQAKSAIATVKIMQDAERPYIFIKITETGIEITDLGAFRFAGRRFCFQLANYGKSPALLTELKETFPIVEGLTDGPPSIDPCEDRGYLLPQGTISSPDKPYELQTNSDGGN